MSAMDGIVRLFQEMDADMYEGWSEKRWRHFMPVQLAVESLNNRGHGMEVDLKGVGEMFVGSNVNYNVAECKLVSIM